MQKCAVLFSSKISNSFFAFIDQHRLNKEPLENAIEVPEEFLRNPSSWLDASRMESFLSQIVRRYGDIIESVGLESPTLRAWGVLDGVLRMMSSPNDLFVQPERILSYFISPAPILRNAKKENEVISFDAPFSRDKYPLTATYLLSALESLPVYMGRPPAQGRWVANRIEINLSDKQPNLFGDDGGGQQINPQFLQSLVQSLEKSQKELEEKNRELIEKNNELLLAQKELRSKFKYQVQTEKLSNLSEIAAGLAHEVNNPLAYVMSNLLRLNDYIARSQQLVTILVGQDRLNPQVREAMRRMDWDYIVKEYPQVVKEASEGLQRVRDIVKDLSYLAGPNAKQATDRIPSDLNIIAENAIKMVTPNFPKKSKIQKDFRLNKPIPVIPGRIEQALVNLLNNASHAINDGGTVTISTKLKGDLAEIEIEDDGVGMSEETLNHIFTPYYTTKQPGRGTGLGLSIVHSIIEMHDGKINVQSEKGKGSKFTIDLPL